MPGDVKDIRKGLLRVESIRWRRIRFQAEGTAHLRIQKQEGCFRFTPGPRLNGEKLVFPLSSLLSSGMLTGMI